MTYAPADIATIRSFLIDRLDLVKGTARGVDLEPNEIGIVGDPAHASTGGYHEGNDDLTRVGRVTSDYSKRESGRDRPGSNAASALDIGDFDVTRSSSRITLRTLSAAIVAACKRGDPRTRDVREVIWSPDGSTVQRWDRLGLRSTGDSTHRWHTHISFHRDAEGRRSNADNFLGLLRDLVDGTPTVEGGPTMGTLENLDEANWRGGTAMGPPVQDQFRVEKLPQLPAAAVGVRYGNSHNDRLYAIQRLAEQAVADVAELKARPTGAVVMSASDRDAIVAGLVGGLAKDGGFLAAIAKAVADETARRQQA